jgi:hypothetical protein
VYRLPVIQIGQTSAELMTMALLQHPNITSGMARVFVANPRSGQFSLATPLVVMNASAAFFGTINRYITFETTFGVVTVVDGRTADSLFDAIGCIRSVRPRSPIAPVFSSDNFSLFAGNFLLLALIHLALLPQSTQVRLLSLSSIDSPSLLLFWFLPQV